MKKLLVVGMVGAMVLGMQNMVFAGVENTQKEIEVVHTIGAELVYANTVSSVTAEVRELSEEEIAVQKARVKEICEAVNMTYDEDTTLDDVFMKLTEEQINDLIEQGIIEGIMAVEVTDAVPAMMSVDTAEGISATLMNVEAVGKE